MSRIYIFQVEGKEDFAHSIQLEPLCSGDGITDYGYYTLAKKQAVMLYYYLDKIVSFFPKDRPEAKNTIHPL